MTLGEQPKSPNDWAPYDVRFMIDAIESAREEVRSWKIPPRISRSKRKISDSEPGSQQSSTRPPE